MPLIRRIRFVAFTAWLVLSGNAVAAEPGHYTLDPVHTRVMFTIDHAGFSKAIGTVSGSTGTLVFDPEDWNHAKLQATVPLARIDLGDERWNKAALARNLLDVADHPFAEFLSTRVEPVTPDRAIAYGTLTLRGISREIALDIRLNAVKRHPLPPFRRTAGFSATTTLSRKDFGIDAWPSVIGDTVELRIEAEAIRSRAANEPDTPDAPETASSVPQPAETTAPDLSKEPSACS